MKKKYNIEVDCANCAAKMEVAVGKLPGVTAATVNYLAQKMILEFTDDADVDALLQTITKTCKKIDSDFTIEM